MSPRFIVFSPLFYIPSWKLVVGGKVTSHGIRFQESHFVTQPVPWNRSPNVSFLCLFPGCKVEIITCHVCREAPRDSECENQGKGLLHCLFCFRCGTWFTNRRLGEDVSLRTSGRVSALLSFGGSKKMVIMMMMPVSY